MDLDLIQASTKSLSGIRSDNNLFGALHPQSNGDLKRKWTWAVEWLGDELERRPYPGNPQYTYNNWSPPVQSNETSNGYFLERSHSARMTLAKACELCPEEVTPSPLFRQYMHFVLSSGL